MAQVARGRGACRPPPLRPGRRDQERSRSRTAPVERPVDAQARQTDGATRLIDGVLIGHRPEELRISLDRYEQRPVDLVTSSHHSVAIDDVGEAPRLDTADLDSDAHPIDRGATRVGSIVSVRDQCRRRETHHSNRRMPATPSRARPAPRSPCSSVSNSSESRNDAGTIPPTCELAEGRSQREHRWHTVRQDACLCLTEPPVEPRVRFRNRGTPRTTRSRSSKKASRRAACRRHRSLTSFTMPRPRQAWTPCQPALTMRTQSIFDTLNKSLAATSESSAIILRNVLSLRLRMRTAVGCGVDVERAGRSSRNAISPNTSPVLSTPMMWSPSCASSVPSNTTKMLRRCRPS